MKKLIFKILYDVLIIIDSVLVLTAMYLSPMYPSLIGILLLGYGILIAGIIRRYLLNSDMEREGVII